MAFSASSSSAAKADSIRTTAEDTIVFWDVETSAPPRCALLEFGAILLRRLSEVDRFSTLVQPADLDSSFPPWAARSNGITYQAIADAPKFCEVADRIYGILHGRVWAGHNIVNFDVIIIREAFAEIGRTPPEPRWIIDTLPLLRQCFGDRAGDMKEQKCPPEVRKLLQGVSVGVPNNLELAAATMELGERFLEPDDVSTECIRIKIALLHRPYPRTVIQHQGAEIKLRCAGLNVPFGLGRKFPPKLSVLVEIPDSLSKVLHFVDDLASKSSPQVYATSEWRPLVKRSSNGRPTVRLNIVLPTTVVSSDAADANYLIICNRERTFTTEGLVSRTVVDAAELEGFIPPGSTADAFFSLQVSDYKPGVRLVANGLFVRVEEYESY